MYRLDVQGMQALQVHRNRRDQLCSGKKSSPGLEETPSTQVVTPSYSSLSGDPGSDRERQPSTQGSASHQVSPPGTDDSSPRKNSPTEIGKASSATQLSGHTIEESELSKMMRRCSPKKPPPAHPSNNSTSSTTLSDKPQTSPELESKKDPKFHYKTPPLGSKNENPALADFLTNRLSEETSQTTDSGFGPGRYSENSDSGRPAPGPDMVPPRKQGMAMNGFDPATQRWRERSTSKSKGSRGSKGRRSMPDSPEGSVRSDGSFNPSHNMCTPRLNNSLSYKNLEERRLPYVAPPSGMVDRPNHEDSLRRVACVIHRHLVTCEEWYQRVRPEKHGPETAEHIMQRKRAQQLAPWKLEKAEIFREDLYTIPQYKYTFLRTPLGLNTSFYRVQQVPRGFEMPNVQEIHDFLHTLFTKAYLSPECSIICLIYVEKIMEKGDIPILSFSWRPILLAGLLLASKVWQDLSTWNVEFNAIYPEFMLEKINILEGIFLKYIKWDLYISSKLYAKYYFALRAITEKKDFRRRYALIQKNINPPHAEKVAQRTKMMKDDFAELLSRSL